MAEREGFEPPCRLPGKTLSRRPRYDHFGTSPFIAPPLAVDHAKGVPPSVGGGEDDLTCGSLFARRRRWLPASPLAEELLNQLAALGFEHAGERLQPMIQGRMLVGTHR